MRSTIALLAFVVLAAVDCSAGDGTSSTSTQGGLAAPVSRTSTATSVSRTSFAVARANTETGVVTLRTKPGAACTLASLSGPQPAQSARAFADFEGAVRLSVTRTAGGPSTMFSVKCAAGETTDERTLDLASPSLFEAPPPATESAPFRIRPALTVDPESVSKEQLIAGGYPLKPAAKGTAVYATWLKAVTSDTRIVDPVLVPMPERRFGTGMSGQGASPWGGAEMNAAVTYEAVLGGWTLPPIAVDNTIDVSEVNFWAGLGGDSTTGGGDGLIQDGVRAFTLQGGAFGGQGNVTGYSFWTEYFPNAPNYITSISPRLNDAVLVVARAADANGNVNPSGAEGCFSLEDVTQNVSTSTCTTKPTSDPNNVTCTPLAVLSACPVSFIGATAEVEVEPANAVATGGGAQQLEPLSNFGTIELGAIGEDTAGNLHDFGTDPDFIDILFEETDVSIADALDVEITWFGSGM